MQENELITTLERTIDIQKKIIDELKFITDSKTKCNKRIYVTDREYEVIRLISQGLNSREVSNKLGIKYSTVRAHIKNTYSLVGKQFPHSLVQIASMFLGGYIGRKKDR